MVHHLIIFPGLGNHIGSLEKVVSPWKNYGFTPHIVSMNWFNPSEPLQQKLNRANKLIASLAQKANTISLLGTSAGGSAAVNCYCQNKKKIYRVINVCGRLRQGDGIFFSFNSAVKRSHSFKESVLLSESTIEKLTPTDKKKILTVRALFDEVVPHATVPIDGATNIFLPSIEHMITISLALTVFKEQLISFLKEA